jgi:hypothetical protein
MVYSALLNAFTPDIERGMQEDIQHADDHFEFGHVPNVDDALKLYQNPVMGGNGFEYLGGLSRPPGISDAEDEPQNNPEFTDDDDE